MEFAEKFSSCRPRSGTVLLMWLGQAGFLLKNSQGKVLVLDAYLSELAWEQDGNKRITPAVCAADDIKADVVLASHHHTDHLDLKSIPVWMKQKARLYCCRDSYELCMEKGFPRDLVKAMKPGDEIDDSGFHVEAVFADHGDAAPAALGFLIETEGVRIYFTGDTAFQEKRMQHAFKKQIDVLLLPVNGEFGNMNERDAAMLAKQVQARLTVPCHFWTFARHQGSPYDFQLEMHRLAPECRNYLMAQGEIISVSHED